MKLELTEENVLSTVHFIEERCRHQVNSRGYLDDISYYEFRAQLQGIALLLSGHVVFFLLDRILEAQHEISSLYKNSAGLALSPAQPVEAVGQGATIKSCECDGSGFKVVAGFGTPCECCGAGAIVSDREPGFAGDEALDEAEPVIASQGAIFNEFPSFEQLNAEYVTVGYFIHWDDVPNEEQIQDFTQRVNSFMFLGHNEHKSRVLAFDTIIDDRDGK